MGRGEQWGETESRRMLRLEEEDLAALVFGVLEEEGMVELIGRVKGALGRRGGAFGVGVAGR